eukprot:6268592-Alexandrium_andersonii.AAC.1
MPPECTQTSAPEPRLNSRRPTRVRTCLRHASGEKGGRLCLHLRGCIGQMHPCEWFHWANASVQDMRALGRCIGA